MDQRLAVLNQVFPSRSLGGQAPLQAYPQAAQSSRPYRPEWEAELFDLQRIYAFLARGRWIRETSTAGEFALGMKRYNTGRTWAHTTVSITFDAATLQLVAQKVDTDWIKRFAIRGISPTDLLGELPPYHRMPHYQLSLPYSREVWRKDQAVLMASGTTF